MLAGAAGLAASLAVVAAVVTLPLPSAQAQPAAHRVSPVPAAATVACPGSLLSLGSATSTTSISALAAGTAVAGGDSASPKPVQLAAPDASGSSPEAFHEKATSATKAPLLAAAERAQADSPELRGLAVANCAQPDFEQWLVGGATSLGATTLVVLGNPGDVAATVNIDAYSEQGTAAAAGGSGILVQPHTQRVIPLAGLVPNASATVVHVTSTGGTVSAQLQESEISGITPQGADWVGPTAAPATKLVIPGAVFAASGPSAATASDSGDGGVPLLRVLPVGTKDAKLTIGVKPAGGKGGGTALTASASHGVVSEIPLDKVAKGSYTITVDSTQPVVVAAHTSTLDAKAGADFAWFPAATPLTGAAAIPVALGPGVALHLVNPSNAAATLKLAGTGGGSVSVPAGGSVTRPLTHSTVLTTSDAHGVYASVSYQGAGALAAYVAYPTSASASALTVYRR